ncbi:MAG TPA: glycoside hydrolase family 3 C-terminal domain-containing protein [Acidobacteriaceae bacterium]|nr:glycoside hydrolase family 3 C-terminal domain-containing protein [Acidobacteriaceae bacterium]
MIGRTSPQAAPSQPTRSRCRTAAFLLLALLAGGLSTAQNSVPVVTGDARVDKLLSQMTLQEKMALIRGAWEPASTNQGQAGYLAGVPRLGIPPLRMADGPPGVLTRLPSQAETATMGVAATFSKQDAEQNGVVIAREAHSLGIDVVLQPFINIDRDITFARGYNTFGEDPLLTGEIGAAEIRGVQGQHIMAMAKHYVAYDTDGSNVYVDPQPLHEIYVAPFVNAVNAGVSSIMCSYNKVNGTDACGNASTLKTILRDQLGFKGFLTSDWGAVHSPNFINQGLDVEMPGKMPAGNPMGAIIYSFYGLNKPVPAPPPAFNTAVLAGFFGRPLPEEPPMKPFSGGFGSLKDQHINFWNLMQSGQLTEATITKAAGHVLYEIDKFGYLDHPPAHTIQPHDTEANAKVIQKTAEDAAVLLKNEGGVLPLKSADLGSLAMIGPGAGQVVAIGTAGERSIGWPWRQIGPLQAMQKDAPDAHITYAVADDMTGKPIPAANLTHDDGQPGLLRAGTSSTTQVDPQIDFTKKSGKSLPANTPASWTGTLTVPEAGSYWIYLQLLGAAGSLSLDGKPVAAATGLRGAVHGDTVLAGKDGLMPTTDGLDNVRVAVQLPAGPHRLKLTIEPDTSNNPEQVRLAWTTPEQRKATYDQAIAAARTAKTAIVFAWTRGKPNFALPGDQDKLIDEIASINPNTIVVLNVSQPVALPWLSKVKAVLQMWWPGDEGGWATANILLGKTSPAGRLPFTWARQLADYPATDPAHPERSAKGVNGKTTYSEGIYVGYRWFDKKNLAPLFPFGYGLSYSHFHYSDLKVMPAQNGGLTVNFVVKNTGTTDSDEVPQVYLGAPANAPADASFAVHALAAFDRIHLAAGASQPVSLAVPLRSLQYWSAAQNQWVKSTGKRQVLVGRSSRDLPLQTAVTVP